MTLIRHSSKARDGNAKEIQVQDRILKPYGFSSAQLVTGNQVHGVRVAVITSLVPQTHPETDGLLTDRSGIALGVFTADCMPIFIWASAGNVVGILHAGRRGAANKILSRAASVIKSQWAIPAKELHLYLGPHIRECCYEVGHEVAAEFSSSCQENRRGKTTLSLRRSILEEAGSLGIPKEQIASDPNCTAGDPNFLSHRRTKTPERMLSFILIQHEKTP